MNAIACCFANAMESEATTIARGLRRRDPELLDHLIEQYQHRLLRYLVYLSGNREVAEDLFQETWIRVMERGHQYNGRHEFSTWLSPVSLDLLVAHDEHAPFELIDTRPSAWEVAARRQQTEHISAALAALPTEYREAIVLRFHDGLALEEIAAVTGAPLGTVKIASVSRARPAGRAIEGNTGMSGNVHERARELIALAGGQDLSAVQQTWLRAHLQECAPCSDYAETVGRTVSALRSQPLIADFALVQATRLRVRSRALELRQQQVRAWLVCLSCIFVGISAAITTPLFWRAFEWIGTRAAISSWVWQSGFAFFWIAPALVVSVLLLAHGTHLTNDGE